MRKLLPAKMLTGVERTRPPVPFAALSEAERAVRGVIEAVEFKRIAERAVEEALARHQGRGRPTRGPRQVRPLVRRSGAAGPGRRPADPSR
jgi:hypothetical protein